MHPPPNDRAASDRIDVAILGAGPAGLTSAVALHRANRSVRVAEKASFVGGLARTAVHGEFRFDLGGHRFYTKNAAVVRFLRELLGDELLEVDRLSRIHFRGRFVDYPVRPLDALRAVGLGTAARIVKDLVAVALRPPRQDARSLEDWMVAAYGRTLYETFFKVYAEKVWGLPAHRICAELAAQRVRGFDLLDTIKHALRPGRARADGAFVERFSYPRLGFGQISDAMAAVLPRDGLRLRTVPERIVHDRDLVRCVELRGDDGELSTWRCDQVVSSIPVPALVHLFDPPPPSDVLAAADALGFRAIVFVAVFVDVPSIRPESWIYFPSPEISFGRVVEPRNWSSRMSPPGRSSIVAEHFCDVADATWCAHDADLAERTIDDLANRLGWFPRERVLDTCVIRARHAYPRMDIDHLGHLRKIERWFARFANLQLVGRGGMFRYHNTDHAIETGLAAAARILGDSTADPRAVNVELAYHEKETVRCGHECS